MELAGLVDRAVSAAVARQLPAMVGLALTNPFLMIEETIELTGISRWQLAYRRKAGCIPYFKRGWTVLFRTEDVYEWIEAGYVPASSSRRKA